MVAATGRLAGALFLGIGAVAISPLSVVDAVTPALGLPGAGAALGAVSMIVLGAAVFEELSQAASVFALPLPAVPGRVADRVQSARGSLFSTTS